MISMDHAADLMSFDIFSGRRDGSCEIPGKGPGEKGPDEKCEKEAARQIAANFYEETR